MFNQIRFNTDKFGAEALTQESKLVWLRVNTQVRQTIPMKVETTHLNLQDELANLDDLTALSDKRVFNIVRQPIESYEKSNDV